MNSRCKIPPIWAISSIIIDQNRDDSFTYRYAIGQVSVCFGFVCEVAVTCNQL